MSNPVRPRRAGVAVLALTLVVVGVAACSATTVETDTTTTIQAMTGTLAPDDAGPGTTDEPTTTTDEPRAGTTVLGGRDDPPTGDETEAEYAAALVASFEGDADEVFTQADVECIAPKWVSAIGVEAFQAAGITPADIADRESGLDDIVIDASTAEQIVDSIPECGLDLMALFIDGQPARIKDDPAKVACIEAAVTTDQVRASLIDEIRGAEGQDVDDLAGGCLD